MLVLADSAAWVGVAGTAVGGLIAFATTWLIHRSERAERSRAERKEAYAALLTHAEDSMHLFQWLAEGRVGPGGAEEDRLKADVFYDQEVVPRYRVLKIIGTEPVVKAARETRDALNAVRGLVVKAKLTAKSPGFSPAHQRYRKARNGFIDAARADLQHRRRRLSRSLRAGARDGSDRQ